jgi:dipeptidyl aminopeptidase/acylaminoacyl peptidase
LVKWSNDSIYIYLADCYIKGFNKTSKGFHLFSFYNEKGEFGLFEQKNDNAKLMSLERSKNKETLLLRKMTVSQYPEIILVDKFFQNERTISTTNQQQNDYNWATVELLKWKAFDGEPLEGLLYKPENFDPSKKYPLLVYFYELNSENLHNHLAPRPSASTINPTEYASAGYFVLIPDIRYSAGYPAKSAYNCIVSGTDFVVKNYPINENKLGLQGQSWGGYQTAQLITMTTKYAAAMAGAPVSNMFSAYGGIRWGSGLNRQFQYESTQSRIGKTIWDAPERYIENSPLFHLPNVKTPLLIMHNDSDGAVPWYQGIELYNGMRRLGKPCWLLNYNDDDHNLKKAPNRIDLSIRMRQFFDHYLLDKQAPEWLKSGLPALEKGKKFGYETEE